MVADIQINTKQKLKYDINDTLIANYHIGNILEGANKAVLVQGKISSDCDLQITFKNKDDLENAINQAQQLTGNKFDCEKFFGPSIDQTQGIEKVGLTIRNVFTNAIRSNNILKPIEMSDEVQKGNQYPFPVDLAEKLAMSAAQNNGTIVVRYSGQSAFEKYELGRPINEKEANILLDFADLPHDVNIDYDKLSKTLQDPKNIGVYGKDMSTKPKSAAEISTSEVRDLGNFGDKQVVETSSKGNLGVGGFLFANQKFAKSFDPALQVKADKLLEEKKGTIVLIDKKLNDFNRPQDLFEVMDKKTIPVEEYKEVSMEDAGDYILHKIPVSGTKENQELYRLAYVRADKHGQLYEAIGLTDNKGSLIPDQPYNIVETPVNLSSVDMDKVKPEPIMAHKGEDGKVRAIIGDIDPAIFLFQNNNKSTKFDPKMGAATEKEFSVIKELNVSTNNMTHHSSENHNPETIGLAISEKDPVVCFTVDKKVFAINNMPDFAQFLTNEMSHGRVGKIPAQWNLDVKDKVVTVSDPQYPWGNVSSEIYNMSNQEQKKFAKEIYDTKVEAINLKNNGFLQDKLDQYKNTTLEQEITKLENKRIELENKYQDQYKTASPAAKAEANAGEQNIKNKQTQQAKPDNKGQETQQVKQKIHLSGIAQALAQSGTATANKDSAKTNAQSKTQGSSRSM